MALATPTLHPPGPRSRVPGRLLARFARDRLAFLEWWAREHGDVSWFRDLGASFALLNHPDLVRDVLVTQARMFHKGIGLERARLLLGNGLLTSEDAEHMRQRRLMQPAFHRERVAAYGAVMGGFAERHVARWRPGSTLDLSVEMAALTLAIAGKTLFDADVVGDTAAIAEAVQQSIEAFGFVLLPFGDRFTWLPVGPAQRFREARARMDAIIYRLIRERRAELAEGGRDRGDLLTMLVVAQDAEAGGAGMTDQQVRDEALTILLAGHETTANALAWSFHLLARHPEVERALHAEADAVLTSDEGEPRAATVDDLGRLPYARMVVSESMRLRPPAFVLGRRALAPYAVPGTPWTVPAGTTVFFSQYLLHRDARFWPDPDRFDPERWRGDGTSAPERPRFAYFPFGAGTRVCIGEQFAWMELTLVLATIARRWRLALVPGHPVVPQPVITLRAKHGIRVVAQPRA